MPAADALALKQPSHLVASAASNRACFRGATTQQSSISKYKHTYHDTVVPEQYILLTLYDLPLCERFETTGP